MNKYIKSITYADKGDLVVKTLHRTLCALILSCIGIAALQAQGLDTTAISTKPPALVPPTTKSFLLAGKGDTLWLSSVPTVFELTQIFAAPGKADLDPFVALQAVISKSDSAVGALDSLLFLDSIAKILTTKINPPVGGQGREVTISDTVRPNKLYAVMALEAIGSKTSYPVLVRVAQWHPSQDVRGLALKALSTTFHEGERLQKFVPDKELVHLLLANVDDTTNIPYLTKSFGQVAREGLIQWLGEDFGEPQGADKRLRDARGGDRGSLADYREEWWQANTLKIYWDSENLHFGLKH